jgi:hypothetical protein
VSPAGPRYSFGCTARLCVDELSSGGHPACILIVLCTNIEMFSEQMQERDRKKRKSKQITRYEPHPGLYLAKSPQSKSCFLDSKKQASKKKRLRLWVSILHSAIRSPQSTICSCFGVRRESGPRGGKNAFPIWAIMLHTQTESEKLIITLHHRLHHPTSREKHRMRSGSEKRRKSKSVARDPVPKHHER